LETTVTDFTDWDTRYSRPQVSWDIRS
jgi:hypothetical protein